MKFSRSSHRRPRYRWRLRTGCHTSTATTGTTPTTGATTPAVTPATGATAPPQLPPERAALPPPSARLERYGRHVGGLLEFDWLGGRRQLNHIDDGPSSDSTTTVSSSTGLELYGGFSFGHGAGDKVAGAASDASKKLASVTGDKKSATKAEPQRRPTPIAHPGGDPHMSESDQEAEIDRLLVLLRARVSRELRGNYKCCCSLNKTSTFALIAGSDNGTKFGITYTLGNIISLCGSGFLVGPKQQVKLMFKPVRRIATMIYLVMIVVVLAVALAAPQLGLVVLLLVLIQCAAAVW
ncbi:Vesicle transport protein, SFT2-like [Phytophthora cactorum]|nr:Vesicle transport protein, SFT2-like [Phytophthora cactorum]